MLEILGVFLSLCLRNAMRDELVRACLPADCIAAVRTRLLPLLTRARGWQDIDDVKRSRFEEA